jgi:hypothetical protein
MGSDVVQRVWSRRPAKAVARLGGRQLLVMSARELLRAATREDLMLVALVASAPAAIAGFARAARDASAPLLLVRPSGSAGEKGPEEARDDLAFTDAAFAAAGDLPFLGPLALLKEPPRAGSAPPDAERVQREIEAGFTGVALAAADTQQDARNAALAASPVVQMELGLEVVPLGGARAAAELARQLRSRGASPSAVRITGLEDETVALSAELGDTALSTATESVADSPRRELRQLVAAGPFLRALRKAASAATWEELQAWADEKGATLEQAAARHQRLLRDLPPDVQERLEALCCFEALELFRKTGAQGTSARLIAAAAALHQGEE